MRAGKPDDGFTSGQASIASTVGPSAPADTSFAKGQRMAAPTNTVITNSAVGNRESLHNVISLLNRDETPFVSAIG
jgi:hypothetical protein